MQMGYSHRERCAIVYNIEISFTLLINTKIDIPICILSARTDFDNNKFAFSSSINVDKYAVSSSRNNKYFSQGAMMFGEQKLICNLKTKI